MTNDRDAIEALAAGVEADELKERARLEDVLHLFVNARNQRDAGDEYMKKWSPVLREWLQLHVGEQLVDAEREIVAYLSSPPRSTRYDMMRMPDDLVLMLHKVGALSVNKGVIDALAKTGHEVTERLKHGRFEVPTEGTAPLQVKRLEDVPAAHKRQ